MGRALVVVIALAFGCATPPGAMTLGDGGLLHDAAVLPGDARALLHDAAAHPDANGAIDAGARDGGAHDAGHDAGPPPPPPDAWPGTNALLRPSSPMPCADPAVVSEDGAARVYYVYCTGMGHVWTTSDWVDFRDVRSSTTFDLAGMSANGRSMGSWWAPGVIYAPSVGYVMWVSVPDANATSGSNGWSSRSLAVLTSPSASGPWTFRALAIDAATDEMFIDPFPFLDADGSRYVFWKQYGGGVSSSIMGARVDAAWTGIVAGTRIELVHGYGGTGTWEDNVRENPAVWRDAAGHHHLIFSGGHWNDGSYATGHAISTCGPLCAGGWQMQSSGDRGIEQVVRAFGNPDFTHGGPGGAVFMNDHATDIIYAAAAHSRSGDTTRYLMRDRIAWQNRAPFVDTAGHAPVGF
jgi:hypothetical protein